MKTPIVFLLCFTLISMNLVCFADPNLPDAENYKKGSELHTHGKYQDAYDLYFKDMSPTPKNIKWLQDYKVKYRVHESGILGTPLVASPIGDGSNINIADNCNLGLEAAKKDAQQVGGGNLAGGIALGFTLGLVGTLIAVVIAGPSKPRENLLADKTADYSNCYTKVYLSETKSRKKNKALIGGLIGTLATVVIITAVSHSL